MSDQQKDTRTAAQRIEDLENATMQIYPIVNNMARDLMLVKDALKLLGNKVDAIMKTSVAGLALNDENVSQAMIQNSANELKGKVDQLISAGVIKATDSIKENTFVVGEEIGKDGKVINPRLQFGFDSLTDKDGNNKEFQEKIKGGKPGDVIAVREDLSFKVMEVYEIVPTPAAAQTAPEATQPAQEATPAVIPVEATAEAPTVPSSGTQTT